MHSDARSFSSQCCRGSVAKKAASSSRIAGAASNRALADG
jgi:hypothetical protein